MFSFLREYLNWRKEHKTEVYKIKFGKQLLKHPLNYNLLEEWLKVMTDSKSRDLVIEMEGADYKVRIYYDNDKDQFTHKSMTQRILENS